MGARSSFQNVEPERVYDTIVLRCIAKDAESSMDDGGFTRIAVDSLLDIIDQAIAYNMVAPPSRGPSPAALERHPSDDAA